METVYKIKRNHEFRMEMVRRKKNEKKKSK
jgi:hypothetical protein